MMKKIISILLTLSLLLSFAGCTVLETGETSSGDRASSTPAEEKFVPEENPSSVSQVSSSTAESATQPYSSSQPQTPSSAVTLPPPSSQPEVPSSALTNEKPVNPVGTGVAEPVSPAKIPAYSGRAYAVINNNIPNFSGEELATKGYEKYSDLDSLGRTRVVIASVGRDTMPGAEEERTSISSIKPTGWKQAQYDCISGGWLYNRCHLIGWQLSAENANKSNLITGTKYLNISGMLPFENMVADYINETGNHVAYRVTPIYEGNNLLASGVQMEAYSVEDDGEGICFNVYCYNVQPEVTINYATGASTGPTSSETPSSAPTITKPDPQPSTGGGAGLVWIPKTGSKYHSHSGCSNMKNPSQVTKTEAERRGYTACKKCW